MSEGSALCRPLNVPQLWWYLLAALVSCYPSHSPVRSDRACAYKRVKWIEALWCHKMGVMLPLSVHQWLSSPQESSSYSVPAGTEETKSLLSQERPQERRSLRTARFPWEQINPNQYSPIPWDTTAQVHWNWSGKNRKYLVLGKCEKI